MEAKGGNSRMDFDAALQHVLEQVRAAGIPASAQIDPQVRVNTRAKKTLRALHLPGRPVRNRAVRALAGGGQLGRAYRARPRGAAHLPGLHEPRRALETVCGENGGAVRVFDSAHGGLRPSAGAAADGNTLFAAVHVLRRGVCAAAHEQARPLSGALPLPVRRQAAAVTLRA